ncbi:transcriptional regulator [Aquitalea magnusonii]|jgi:transcriptional regulator|uniref:Transcriptional regulator n=1 Tax=Aquitalea magnusonii TaxID=332411 RepID=A0A3G9GSH3_9NEIS|nr:FMN-binding negative transcriptional regulator [Aquitalea magnusonii]BBF87427.1 transcriptional regulator [Aquitalea magnusonii]
MSLYCPSAFRAEAEYAARVMADNPLATLMTPAGDEPWISHVVLLPDPQHPDCLLGHLARANPHAAVLFAQDSVAVFAGVHGYVSPRWYVSDGMVPTWNYRVAHAHGRAEPVDGEQLTALLQQLARHFEGPAGWSTDAMPAQAMAAMQRGIVGFRLRVARWDVKAKLSQNRLPQDRHAVITALEQGDEAARQLAAAMPRP